METVFFGIILFEEFFVLIEYFITRYFPIVENFIFVDGREKRLLISLSSNVGGSG